MSVLASGTCYNKSVSAVYQHPETRQPLEVAAMDSVPRLCSIEGCEGKHEAKGYCQKHYVRLHRRGTLETQYIYKNHVARFWSYVEKTDNCWFWRGHNIGAGYGCMNIAKHGVLVHRFSYEIHKGPIPEGLFVCHSCDVPNCVNPDHLWLGTPKENTRDMVQKNRHVKGSTRSHAKLTEKAVADIQSLNLLRNSDSRRKASEQWAKLLSG